MAAVAVVVAVVALVAVVAMVAMVAMPGSVIETKRSNSRILVVTQRSHEASATRCHAIGRSVRTTAVAIGLGHINVWDQGTSRRVAWSHGMDTYQSFRHRIISKDLVYQSMGLGCRHVHARGMRRAGACSHLVNAAGHREVE